MTRYDCTLKPNAEFVGTVKGAESERQARSAMRDAYKKYDDGYKPHGVSGSASVHMENLDDTFDIECRKLD